MAAFPPVAEPALTYAVCLHSNHYMAEWILERIRLRFYDDTNLLKSLQFDIRPDRNMIEDYRAKLTKLRPNILSNMTDLTKPLVPEASDDLEATITVLEAYKTIIRCGSLRSYNRLCLEIEAVNVRLGQESENKLCSAIHSFNMDAETLLRLRSITKPGSVSTKEAKEMTHRREKFLRGVIERNEPSYYQSSAKEYFRRELKLLPMVRDFLSRGRVKLFNDFFGSLLEELAPIIDARFNKILEYAEAEGIDRRHVRARRCLIYEKFKLRVGLRVQHPTERRKQRRPDSRV